MNKIKIFSIAILIASSFLFSCGGAESSDSEKADTTKMDTKGETPVKEVENETTSENLPQEGEESKVAKFICAAGCEGGAADVAGNCKVCKMELIENPDYKE